MAEAKVAGKTSRKSVDWDALEPHYRAGLRSLADIAKEFKCSDAAIVKHAKTKEWTRDLAAKIKAKADAKVSAAAVSAEVSAKKVTNEKQVVEANADLQYRVRMEHRQDIGRSRELFKTLLQEVEDLTGNQDLAEQLLEVLHDPGAGDDPDKSSSKAEEERLRKMREAFARIMSSPGRIDSAKKLVETLEKLVRLEREAFGIDDKRTLNQPGAINISF